MIGAGEIKLNRELTDKVMSVTKGLGCQDGIIDDEQVNACFDPTTSNFESVTTGMSEKQQATFGVSYFMAAAVMAYEGCGVRFSQDVVPTIAADDVDIDAPAYRAACFQATVTGAEVDVALSNGNTVQAAPQMITLPDGQTRTWAQYMTAMAQKVSEMPDSCPECDDAPRNDMDLMRLMLALRSGIPFPEKLSAKIDELANGDKKDQALAEELARIFFEAMGKLPLQEQLMAFEAIGDQLVDEEMIAKHREFCGTCDDEEDEDCVEGQITCYWLEDLPEVRKAYVDDVDRESGAYRIGFKQIPDALLEPEALGLTTTDALGGKIVGELRRLFIEALQSFRDQKGKPKKIEKKLAKKLAAAVNTAFAEKLDAADDDADEHDLLLAMLRGAKASAVLEGKKLTAVSLGGVAGTFEVPERLAGYPPVLFDAIRGGGQDSELRALAIGDLWDRTIDFVREELGENLEYALTNEEEEEDIELRNDLAQSIAAQVTGKVPTHMIALAMVQDVDLDKGKVTIEYAPESALLSNTVVRRLVDIDGGTNMAQLALCSKLRELYEQALDEDHDYFLGDGSKYAKRRTKLAQGISNKAAAFVLSNSRTKGGRYNVAIGAYKFLSYTEEVALDDEHKVTEVVYDSTRTRAPKQAYGKLNQVQFYLDLNGNLGTATVHGSTDHFQAKFGGTLGMNWNPPSAKWFELQLRFGAGAGDSMPMFDKPGDDKSLVYGAGGERGGTYANVNALHPTLIFRPEFNKTNKAEIAITGGILDPTPGGIDMALGSSFWQDKAVLGGGLGIRGDITFSLLDEHLTLGGSAVYARDSGGINFQPPKKDDGSGKYEDVASGGDADTIQGSVYISGHPDKAKEWTLGSEFGGAQILNGPKDNMSAFSFGFGASFKDSPTEFGVGAQYRMNLMYNYSGVDLTQHLAALRFDAPLYGGTTNPITGKNKKFKASFYGVLAGAGVSGGVEQKGDGAVGPSTLGDTSPGTGDYTYLLGNRAIMGLIAFPMIFGDVDNTDKENGFCLNPQLFLMGTGQDEFRLGYGGMMNVGYKY